MRITKFSNVKGDGEPFWTTFYRDTPSPFRLEDAWEGIDGQYLYLEDKKEELLRGFNLTYGRYEINGTTYQDFKDYLDEVLYQNVGFLNDVIELMEGQMYQAYDDEMLTVSSRTESGTSSTNEDSSSTSNDAVVDVPRDNANDDKDTQRSKGQMSSDRGTTSDYETVNGGYTEEKTTYGLDRPFEIVNKFIKDGKTISQVFNDTFKDCFIYGEAWYVW